MVQRIRKLGVKLLMVLTVVCCVIGVALASTACSGDTKSVKSFNINTNGELVVTYSDDSTEILGVVRAENGENGADGADGVGITKAEINADGELVITYSDNSAVTVGKVVGANGANGATGATGAPGADGKDGVGIQSIVLSEDGKSIIITYTDETKDATVIPLPGASGEACDHAAMWTAGEYDMQELVNHTQTQNGTYLIVYHCCEGEEVGHSELRQAIIHTWESRTVPATCTEGAYIARVCTVCGQIAEKEYTSEALGHVVSEHFAVVEEGMTVCEDGGFLVKKCDVCGDTLGYTPVAPTGHTVEWSELVAPTDEREGSIKGTCTVCGEEETIVLPALMVNGNLNPKYKDYTEGEREYCYQTRTDTYVIDVQFGDHRKQTETVTFDVTVAGEEHKIGADKKVISSYYYENVVSRNISYFEYIDAYEGAIEVNKLIELGGVNTDEFTGYEANCGEQTLGTGYYYCTECGAYQPVVTYMAHTPAANSLVSHEGDCTHDTYNEYTCATCSQTYKELVKEAPGHSYTIYMQQTGGTSDSPIFTIYKKCTACGETTTVAENVTDAQRDLTDARNRAATCQQTGIEVWKYTYDGQVYTVAIDIGYAAHSLYYDVENESYVSIETLKTEITIGNVTKKVVNVNTKVVLKDGKLVLAGEGETGSAAITEFDPSTSDNYYSSCKEGEEKFGYGSYVCACCGERQPIETYRTHTFAAAPAFDPTYEGCREPDCTTPGIYVALCTGCNEKIEVEVPALGHENANTLLDDPAETDPKYMLLTEVCTREGCGHSEAGIKVEILSKGDLVANGDCSVEEENFSTWNWTVLYRSGANINTQATIVARIAGACHVLNGAPVVGSLPWNTVGLTETDPATCTTTGTGTYVCEVCDVRQTVVTTKSHKFEDTGIAQQPTCTVDGVMNTKCIYCNATGTRPIAAEGHVVTAVVTVAPTKTETGTATITCSNCDDTTTMELPVLPATTPAVGATVDGYKLVSTTGAATCTEPEKNVWSYTLQVDIGITAAGASVTTPVEVTIEEIINVVPHTPVGDFVAVFVKEHGANGQTYVGKYCTECEQFIVYYVYAGQVSWDNGVAKDAEGNIVSPIASTSYAV